MEERMGSRSLGKAVGAAVSFGMLTGATGAVAAVVTGDGGRGVPVGQSGLIKAYDYGDTFTGSFDGGVNPNRPYTPAIQPPGAYTVENTYGHPSTNFQSGNQGPGIGNFSIASDSQGRITPESPNYPG